MNTNMQKILLVEDDKEIVKNLSRLLKEEGFCCENVRGQKEALSYLDEHALETDLALLDISLEDGNGFAVCSAIKNGTDIPVIFLTASGDEYSTITGLDMGADDYIAKPFRPRELISRIKSVLRRAGKAQSVILLGDGEIILDVSRGTVMKEGQEVFLSALEYKLLLTFANNKGKVISRNSLLEEIWDVAGEYVNDNTLTVYIKRLRERIEKNPSEPRIIKTVRGIGYRVD